ncbi:MAG: metallophosphoesterase [Candidatus Babeliaceae bacterium]|jgi:hypothetical protein
MADLHGDIHTLLAHLKDLKDKEIIDDNLTLIGDSDYLAFLGDCGDSGDSSCDVWALLMRLRIINKDKCILVRGNHETIGLAGQQGFGNELDKKFDLFGQLETAKALDSQKTFQHIVKPYYSFFNYLPAAVFFGYDNQKKDHIDYACLSHAGVELGWQDHDRFLNDPKNKTKSMPLFWNREEVIADNKVIHDEVDAAFKSDDINKREETRALQNHDYAFLDIGQPQKSGFMWNFYTALANEPTRYNNGWTYSQKLTQEVLRSWSNTGKKQSLKKCLNSFTMALLGKKFFDATTYSVRTNIRGHQHVTPQNFAEKVPHALEIKAMYLTPTGIYHQWADNTQMIKKYFIKPGDVYTLKNAPCNIYGYPYPVVKDTIKRQLWYDKTGSRSCLALPQWTLESTNLKIFDSTELPKDMQKDIISLKDYLD